jgi:hypothetical protein
MGNTALLNNDPTIAKPPNDSNASASLPASDLIALFD